jgi:hypothetical protein
VTHHVRKIVALSEIYGIDQTARAIDDALEFEAFRCEYIANLLEQRQRVLPEPGALHVTRRQDLLELELPEPDMSVYGGADETRAATGPNPAGPNPAGPAPSPPAGTERGSQAAPGPIKPPVQLLLPIPDPSNPEKAHEPR